MNMQVSRNGSAFVLVLGLTILLVLSGIMMSRNTVTGRWFTTRSSFGHIAETYAEAASNMTFKAIQEEVNNASCLWDKLEGKGAKEKTDLLDNWFFFFRVPAPLVEPYSDTNGEPYKSAVREGKDIALDLSKFEKVKSLFEEGITYRYDTVVTDIEKQARLAPLKDLFDSKGGRVIVESTGRIVNAYSILPTSPDYKIPGVTCWTKAPRGLFAFLDNAVIGNKVEYSIDLIELVPDEQLIPIPDVTGLKAKIGPGIPVPVGYLLQPLVDKITQYVRKGIDAALQATGNLSTGKKLTWRTAVGSILGGKLEVPLLNVDYGIFKPAIDNLVKKVLPAWLLDFKDNVVDGTIEKQGVFEIHTTVRFFPYATPGKPETGPVFEKNLQVHREFRVADIQPIAGNYSFFVGNSNLPYENPKLENEGGWAGDDEIDFNEGMGCLVIHNFNGFRAIWNTIQAFSNPNLKNLFQKVEVPGNIRINGTNTMRINLNMLSSYFPKSLEWQDVYNFLRVIELPALLSGHGKKNDTVCWEKHPDGKKKTHSFVPQIHEVMYNFWDEGKPFDWGFFCGAAMDSPGSIWFPMIPMFSRTLLFGDFHMEPPLSLKVEGDLEKAYTHIKILLVKIWIPAIPPFLNPPLFPIEIPIPWTWAKNHKEPYGYCRFPPAEKGSAFAQYILQNGVKKLPWSPGVPENNPPNLYSTTQYVKKAGFFYNSSDEFEKDVENRSVEINGRKVFVCDGVSFVNDNLWLTKPLHVIGRGMVVAAGNIHIKKDVTKEPYDEAGNPTVFSLVARNGSIVNNYGKVEVHACLFGDQGLKNTIGARLNVYGNLAVNRFNRKLCQGDVDVHFQSGHCRSSILSLVRGLSKFDPCRYQVTFSSRPHLFRFLKTSAETKKKGGKSGGSS